MFYKRTKFLEFSSFVDENHIQGKVNTTIKLGLYYNDNLVSVIGFSKKRNGIGHSYDNYYELVRFCSKLNYNIIGGFSKLLQYFIKNNNPGKIVTYADIRWSNLRNNLYEKNGFIYSHKTTPNYWYINQNKRHHRLKYTKYKLIKEGYDKNQTENNIMTERKIYRIYDCGSLVYSTGP